MKGNTTSNVTTLTLGSRPKQGAWKGAGQECNLGVTFTFKNARECKGMSPHTPKWAPTLGVGVSMDSQIFIKQFEGSKIIRLKSSLYY